MKLKQYSRFAEVYDQIGADRFSIEMVNQTLKLFKKHKISPKTGLDICCGTGTAALIFSENGIEMSALDGSSQMLMAARKKSKGHNIKFYKQNLPTFSISKTSNASKKIKFDMISCFYDSINYMLTENNLRKTFVSVHKHLNEKGYFLFDMNTELAFKTLWAENNFSNVKDNIAWVWKNEYNPKNKIISCHAHFFVKKGKHLEKFYELHKERAYPNNTIKKLLRDSGFVVKEFYDFFTKKTPTKDCMRLVVVAQKKSK